MKTLLTIILCCLPTFVAAAQTPVTQIEKFNSAATKIDDVRVAVNTRLAASQANFIEIYTALNGSPWLSQTTAPNIHNVFWIDTSGASPVIKYWDGDSWEVAAAGGDGLYTLPVATTSTLGGVKDGTGVTISADGTISADDQLVGDCTVGPCLDGTSDGGNYIKLWAGTGSYWTSLQAGASAANRSWRLPIDAPPSSGTTYLMNMDEYGQMGFVAPSTFLTPTGSGAALTIDASGFDGNLTTSDNTLQKVSQKVDDLVAGGGGYTNLTEFVGQTAWRLFYSDGSGDVKELSLGSDGEYLKSNGAAVAPSWATPSGAAHDAVTLGTDADAILGLSTQQITLDSQTANTVFASPNGSAGDPTFRALVESDMPTSLATDAEVSAGYQPLDADLTDLADGSLTGSKIGTGISGGNISTGTVADARIDTAIARDTEVTAAINALPALVFGTGLTVTEDTPVGFDTISVTGNTYQAYDAHLTTWAGVVPGTGVTTFIAAPSSTNLVSAVTDETGSGALVFGTSPTLTTPIIADGSTLTFDEGAADPNDADVQLSATDGVVKVAAVNGANNEDLTVDLDQTANTAILGSSTGVTLITTGSIPLNGAINIVGKDADYTIGTDNANEAYGSIFLNTAASTRKFTLPPAVKGMSICVKNLQGVTQILRLAANTGDYIVKSTGARTSAAGEYYGATADAKNQLCVVAYDATDWYVTSEVGTWTEE